MDSCVRQRRFEAPAQTCRSAGVVASTWNLGIGAPRHWVSRFLLQSALNVSPKYRNRKTSFARRSSPSTMLGTDRRSLLPTSGNQLYRALCSLTNEIQAHWTSANSQSSPSRFTSDCKTTGWGKIGMNARPPSPSTLCTMLVTPDYPKNDTQNLYETKLDVEWQLK